MFTPNDKLESESLRQLELTISVLLHCAEVKSTAPYTPIE